MQHKQKWVVPEVPTVMVPQRKNMVSLGTATRQVPELDKKAKEGEDDIEKRARVNWKKTRGSRIWYCAFKYAAGVHAKY